MTPVLVANRMRRGDAVIVRAEGEADTVTAPILRRELNAAIDEVEDAELLIVDMTGVTFIDSTGLAELIRANQRSGNRPTPLHLAVSAELHRILELTGLIEIFALADSVDDILNEPSTLDS